MSPIEKKFTPALSVVIPVYNEEEVLSELYRRLAAVMQKLEKEFEIVFVDDGSNDKSFQILQSFHQHDSHVRVLRLSRNFGHHVAITAGIDHTQGNFVVMMVFEDNVTQDKLKFYPKTF